MNAELKERLHRAAEYGAPLLTCNVGRDDIMAVLNVVDRLETINQCHAQRIDRLEQQQNGYRPDYLLNGTRFKLNFSSCGNVDVFWNYAKQLDGRWVALVPAEDDSYLAPKRQPVELGRVEFHTPKKEALIDRFYAVTKDLTAAGCIVDLWLLDIATVLKEHGYTMEIYKDAAGQEGGALSPSPSTKEMTE